MKPTKTQALMTDGTRIDARRARDGEIISGSKSLVRVGWTGNADGHNIADYFSQDSSCFGEFLGADEFGIEPIFEMLDGQN